jgi:hypothetical protein
MTQAQHQTSIIQQFTRQAGPFADMPEHSQESAFRLMLESTCVTSRDTVLDVACGPGLVPAPSPREPHRSRESTSRPP